MRRSSRRAALLALCAAAAGLASAAPASAAEPLCPRGPDAGICSWDQKYFQGTRSVVLCRELGGTTIEEGQRARDVTYGDMGENTSELAVPARPRSIINNCPFRLKAYPVDRLDDATLDLFPGTWHDDLGGTVGWDQRIGTIMRATLGYGSGYSPATPADSE